MSLSSLGTPAWLLLAVMALGFLAWVVSKVRHAGRVVDQMPLDHWPGAPQASVRQDVTARHALEYARLGDLEALMTVVTREAHPDVADADGKTPLMVAASFGHISVVQVLVDLGADVNWLDRRGLSALGCAALAGDYEVCRWLIEHGADVDHGHPTARELAQQVGRPDLVSA